MNLGFHSQPPLTHLGDRIPASEGQVHFCVLFVKTNPSDKKSQLSVTALIFYCPYTLRRCGRPGRSVPSHHFLSPPTSSPKDLRASRRSSDGSVCAERQACSSERRCPTHASPSPAPAYTLAHTHPTAGRRLVQRPSRLPGPGPASCGTCNTGSLVNALDRNPVKSYLHLRFLMAAPKPRARARTLTRAVGVGMAWSTYLAISGEPARSLRHCRGEGGHATCVFPLPVPCMSPQPPGRPRRQLWQQSPEASTHIRHDRLIAFSARAAAWAWPAESRLLPCLLHHPGSHGLLTSYFQAALTLCLAL